MQQACFFRPNVTLSVLQYLKMFTCKTTQDLVWEQCPDTAAVERLVAGNSPDMIFEAKPANKYNPPLPPQTKVFINKAGSTSGFGAYALYHPARKIGIVMLANRSYPNVERVTVAYTIFQQIVVE